MPDVLQNTEPQLDATAEAPRVSYGEAFRTTPRSNLGPGFEALAEGLDNLGTALAKKEGKADVTAGITRDANGTLQYTPKPAPFLLGRQAVAYRQAVEAGTAFMADSMATRQAIENRRLAKGDPEKFNELQNAQTDATRAKLGGIVGDQFMHKATELSDHFYGAMVNEKQRLDTGNARQEIQAGIDEAKTNLAALVRTGGGDAVKTQTGINLRATIDIGNKTLVDNPLFTTTQEQVDRDNERLKDDLNSQSVSWDVDRWKAQGVPYDEIAKRIQTSITNNPNLSLNDQQRAHLAALAMATLDHTTEKQKAASAALDVAVTGIEEGYKKSEPIVPSEAQLNVMRDQALKLGNAGALGRLDAASKGYEAILVLQHLPPGKMQGAAVATPSIGPVSSDMVHRAIIGQESNFNPAAATSITGATGIGQIEPGTFTQFARSGERIDNSDDNLAVSKRITDSYYQKYGGDPARVAVAYFSGPGNVAPLDAATPYLNDTHDPTGKTTSSYVADVMRRLGQPPPRPQPGPGGKTYPFTPAQLAKNPYLISAFSSQYGANQEAMVKLARQQGEALTYQMNGNIVPKIEDIASFKQLSDQHPAELGELAGKVFPQYEALAATRGEIGGPGGIPAAAAALPQIEEFARNNRNIQVQRFAEAARIFVERAQKDYKEDPVAYASRASVNIVPQRQPFADFGQEIAQRRLDTAATVEWAGEGNPSSLLFSGKETASMAATMAAPGGAGPQLLARLASTMEPAEIGSLNANSDFKNGVSGMLRSGDPQKMRAAFDYMNTSYKRNPLAFEKSFGSDEMLMLNRYESDLQFRDQATVTKELTRALDPGYRKALNDTKELADKRLEGLNANNVVSKLFGSHLPWTEFQIPYTGPSEIVSADVSGQSDAFARQQELLNDVKEIFKDRYALDGNYDTALNYAKEQVANKWGVSAVSGGKLMLFPPERSYPAIDNSYHWMAAQLDDAVRRAHPIPPEVAAQLLKNPASRRDLPPDAARNLAIHNGRNFLVADDITRQGALNAAQQREQGTLPENPRWKGPDYLVMNEGSDGMLRAVEKTPGSGDLLRFAPEPQAEFRRVEMQEEISEDLRRIRILGSGG